jgi:hypothetical protein
MLKKLLRRDKKNMATANRHAGIVEGGDSEQRMEGVVAAAQAQFPQEDFDQTRSYLRHGEPELAFEGLVSHLKQIEFRASPDILDDLAYIARILELEDYPDGKGFYWGTRWEFRTNGRAVELRAPEGVPAGANEALNDFVFAEVGLNSKNLANYRTIWAEVTAENEPGRGISGNGTSQTLDDNGNVLLESLYERWDDVVITRVQFEGFLDQFAAFLRSSRG